MLGKVNFSQDKAFPQGLQDCQEKIQHISGNLCFSFVREVSWVLARAARYRLEFTTSRVNCSSEIRYTVSYIAELKVTTKITAATVENTRGATRSLFLTTVEEEEVEETHRRKLFPSLGKKRARENFG